MPDMTLIAGAITSLRMANDIARGLIAIRDENLRNEKVIELQRVILAAQSDALSAQSDQLTLLQQIGDLEKKIADFETWDAEKHKYELKCISRLGAVAFMLTPEARGSEPPHWLCAQCYENRKKSIVRTLHGELPNLTESQSRSM